MLRSGTAGFLVEKNMIFLSRLTFSLAIKKKHAIILLAP